MCNMCNMCLCCRLLGLFCCVTLEVHPPSDVWVLIADVPSLNYAL